MIFLFEQKPYSWKLKLRQKSLPRLIKLDLISDANDNMILELADECLADFVITGNSNDFTFPIYKNTKIVSPKEYWDSYQPD